jgi:excisionase family DNA binding protein
MSNKESIVTGKTAPVGEQIADTLVGNQALGQLHQMPDCLTIDQARSVLQLSRNTLYKLVTSGEVPSFRLGAQIRIAKTELQRMLGCS